MARVAARGLRALGPARRWPALRSPALRWPAPGTPAGRVLVCALLAAGAAVLVRTAWISDDAYITLRTIDNFVHGHGLRWNIAERVQTFTHPLWLLFLAVPYAVTREAYATTLAVSLGLSFATLALAAFRLNRRPEAGALLIVLLLASRAFVDYCTSGLENPLTHLCLLLFCLQAKEGTEGPGASMRLSVIAGLGVLNRPDTALLFLPGLAFALHRRPRGEALRALACGFAPLVLWELFALAYYGAGVPNTATAKLPADIPAGEMLRQGARYLANSLREDPVTLGMTALAFAAVLRRGRGRERALALGIALYLVYVVRVGGDFMSGRFLSAPFFAAAALLAQREPLPWPAGRAVLLAAVALLSAVSPHRPYLSGADYGLDRREMMDAAGIADERRVYFGIAGWRNGAGPPKPILTLSKRGSDLARDRVPLSVEGAVGVVGYFAGPSVHVLDLHGLGDPLLARLPVVRRDPLYDGLREQLRLGPSPEGWRIGHFHRNLPEGYIATLLTGESRIADPAVRRLYEEVSLLTRAPLWSGRRWRAILTGSVGRAARATRRSRPNHEPVPWDEALAARPDCGEYHLQRGLRRSREGDADGAHMDLEEAVRLSPRRGAAWSFLGELERQRGGEEVALRAWRRGLELDPVENNLLVVLGDHYLRAGRNEEAAEVFQRSLRLDPRQAGAYSNLAMALNGLKRHAEAAAAAERSLRIDASAPEAHDNLGVARLGMGRHDAAIASFRRATELEEAYEPAWRHLGWTLAAAQRNAEAAAALETAEKLDPRNAETPYLRAAIYQRLGERARALAALRRAAALGHPQAIEAERKLEAK